MHRADGKRIVVMEAITLANRRAPSNDLLSVVMAGLVPAIHVFLTQTETSKTWMPGTSPGMTAEDW